MLLAEVGAFAVALVFHIKARPAILRAFADYGTPLPGAARLALSPWWIPGALACAALATVVGLAAPLRRSRRRAVIGAGLVVASVAVVFAVWAAFAAIFQPG
jgi:hypothetical protein